MKKGQVHEERKDYNGIPIPSNVPASKIVITITQKYDGKFGETEEWLDELTMEDYHATSIEDILKSYGIEVQYEDLSFEARDID